MYSAAKLASGGTRSQLPARPVSHAVTSANRSQLAIQRPAEMRPSNAPASTSGISAPATALLMVNWHAVMRKFGAYVRRYRIEEFLFG